MNKLYPCYSSRLMKFLRDEKKIRYELSAKHPNTDCLMWIYIRTNELDKALQEWSEK